MHRALRTMHELSPGYLDAIMSHIDTLLALEQAAGTGDLAPRPAARTEAPRKPVAKVTPKPGPKPPAKSPRKR